jgi:hypothetical protein
MACAMMVIVEHGEDLARAGEPGGLSMGDLLNGIGEIHADRAQPREHVCAALSAPRALS